MRLPFDPWVGKIQWRRDRPPTPVFLGFPGGSAGKESAHNAGDLGSVPGLGRFPGEGESYPFQYSGLENSMDRGAWWATAHGVAKSQTTERRTHTELEGVMAILICLIYPKEHTIFNSLTLGLENCSIF